MHKIFFYNKFIIRLYMFPALCAHHQEVKIVLYSIWYRHTCRWPSGAQVERCTVSKTSEFPDVSKKDCSAFILGARTSCTQNTVSEDL